MRKLFCGLACLSLSLLCSCEKNNCQNSLAGTWIVSQHPPYANGMVVDAVTFFKSDSVRTSYRLSTTDTIAHYSYNSIFITENCGEADFAANMSIGGDSAKKYDILIINSNRFDIRSKANAGCDSCVISLRK